MILTAAQKATLKAAAESDVNLSAFVAAGNWDAVAAYYNAMASPDFWVWRTSVFEAEYTRSTSVDGTTWSWPAYIARSIQEQNAWARLFMGGQSGANPSLANVRQGVADIFSGSTNSAPAQRTHLLTVSRRLATRLEKLFAAGTGSTAAPANLAAAGTSTTANLTYVEGVITAQNVSDAMGGL